MSGESREKMLAIAYKSLESDMAFIDLMESLEKKQGDLYVESLEDDRENVARVLMKESQGFKKVINHIKVTIHRRKKGERK